MIITSDTGTMPAFVFAPLVVVDYIPVLLFEVDKDYLSLRYINGVSAGPRIANSTDNWIII